MAKLISRRHLLAAAAMSGLMALRGPASAAGTRILLINPNSNEATTDMMAQIAQSAAPNDVEIVGATAPHSPPMIVDPEALAASAPQVVELGVGLGKDVSGIIISAFGDPGWTDLRRQVGVPVVGIAEAAMLAASEKGRRFGVATTTPKLVASISHDLIAFVMSGGNSTPAWRLENSGDRADIATPARLVVNNHASARDAAVDGLGVALLPRFQAASFAESGRLIEILPGWTCAPVPVHAMFGSSRYLTPKVRTFIDLASQSPTQF